MPAVGIVTVVGGLEMVLKRMVAGETYIGFGLSTRYAKEYAKEARPVTWVHGQRDIVTAGVDRVGT